MQNEANILAAVTGADFVYSFLILVSILFWIWMVVDCLINAPSRERGGFLFYMIFCPPWGCGVYFFSYFLPELGKRGKQNRTKRQLEEKVEELKRQAVQKNTTRKAVLVANQLGKKDSSGNFNYEDSLVSVRVSPISCVEIWLRLGKEKVFQAEYSDTKLYEYSTGKFLEPRDGGGFDVKEEFSTGGGFEQKILGYIPGDWEAQLEKIYNEACDKAVSEQNRRRKEAEEKKKKNFGL